MFKFFDQKSILFFSVWAFFYFYSSVVVHAATVIYNGYSLDTTTNIVTGGGIDGNLEWLQWDETVGQSVSTALANYGGDGWRLATNAEMSELFNDFVFGLVFDSNENTNQVVTQSTSANSFSAANQFIALFGDTYAAAGFTYDFGDPVEEAQALFGGDPDNDGYNNVALVYDEFINFQNDVIPSYASISDDDIYHVNFSTQSLGVALVRGEVPIPTAAYLLGSALIGLIGLRKLKR